MNAQDLEQRAPVDLEQFREAVRAMDEFIFHRERCGFPHQICDCGMKEARDRLLSIIDNAGKVARQPAPVVDDARMARALEWVRAECGFYNNAEARTHLPAIEEAIAAYDPNCGARTVRVVDDAMRELIEADKEYDAIRQRAQRYPCPGMDEHVMAVRKRRAAALARAQEASK